MIKINIFLEIKIVITQRSVYRLVPCPRRPSALSEAGPPASINTCTDSIIRQSNFGVKKT